jgi:hypothetical protein
MILESFGKKYLKSVFLTHKIHYLNFSLLLAIVIILLIFTSTKVFASHSLNRNQLELNTEIKISHPMQLIEAIGKTYISPEEIYLAEYQKLLKQRKKLHVEYIQAANRLSPCKIFFISTSDLLKDLKQDAKVFWDGKCKNGYADGLGREFLVLDEFTSWSLAVYKNKTPTYYIEKNINLGSYIVGKMQVESLIWYGIKTKTSMFDPVQDIGKFDYDKQTKTFERTYLNNSSMKSYIKEFPNFRYQKDDYTLNRNSTVEYEFALYDKNNIRNGWGMGKRKDQFRPNFGIYTDDDPQPKVLEISYLFKFNAIIQSIEKNKLEALKAYQQALKTKSEYQKRICKPGLYVDFIDEQSYTKICFE